MISNTRITVSPCDCVLCATASTARFVFGKGTQLKIRLVSCLQGARRHIVSPSHCVDGMTLTSSQNQIG